MSNTPDHPAHFSRAAMMGRVSGNIVASGEVTLPAIPELLDDYAALCDHTFKAVGVHFSREELKQLRAILERELHRAFTASPRSEIVITYDIPPGHTANYHITARWRSVAEKYDNWVGSREGSLFGTQPDARVWDLVTRFDDPSTFSILDIGAGTGRNSLPLARRGHPVDAVEMAQKFVEILHGEARREGLDHLRTIPTDLTSSEGHLRDRYDLILLSEVTPDFRTPEQVREVFEIAARRLGPGGTLLFNIFLLRENHDVDAAAIQFGQWAHTAIFTEEQLERAASGLPFELVASDSVYDFEKSHMAAEHWPPTSWYEHWVRGLDVFELAPENSPIEFRWLEYRRHGSRVTRKQA